MEEAKRKLQLLVNELAAKKPVRQAILVVESGDQSFRWAGAAGVSEDGESAIRPDQPFFLASIDKLFNTVIALLLCEQGKLDLEAPMRAYLPESLTHRMHVFKGVDYTDQIRVRHMLSHSSGLPDWLEDAPKNGRSVVEQVLEEGDRLFPLEEITALVRERLSPHFAPANNPAGPAKIRYSDTNFILLIAIIEAITGKKMHKVHEEILLQPLDLRHTFFPGYSEASEPSGAALPLRADGRRIEIPLLIQSFRGVYTTASDAIAFFRSLTRNQIFQNPGSFQKMQANWNRFGMPTDKAALRAPGWPIEYGLGMMRFQLPRLFSGLRRLPAVVGHTGSPGSWLFWCEEMDLFMAGSVDEVSAGAIPYRVAPETIKILYGSGVFQGGAG